jgi:hypothetical protein
MDVGKLVVNIIALALVILPPLFIIFPKNSIAPGQTLLSSYPQFRLFKRDDATILTMRMLRVTEKWVNRYASSMYIRFAALLVLFGIAAHVIFHADIAIALALVVVLDVTFIPWLAIFLTKISLRERYKKERIVYSRVITKSLILVSAQLRSSLTAETILTKLPEDLPSAATERFAEDISTFRQLAMSRVDANADADTSIGAALVELGIFWNLSPVILIGKLLQVRGLNEEDVADQMTSQVRLAYLHEMTDDARYYKTREVSMTGLMMVVFLVSLILPLIPIVAKIFSHSSVL